MLPSGTRLGPYETADPPGGLLFFDFATRQSRQVIDLQANLGDSYCSIALAPDGKSLVIPLLEDATSDSMLVEDFE